MGYRLEVDTKLVSKGKQQGKEPFNHWCGGKLYGYLDNDNEHQLESFNYLLKLGKFNKEKKHIKKFYGVKDNSWVDYLIWDYGFEHKIELTHKQFLEFAEFYKRDLEKYYQYDINIILNDLTEFCKNKENKILEWY